MAKSKWYSDGVPATDPAKEAVKAAKTLQEKVKAEEIREGRIEQIMAVMMQFADKRGEPTWNRHVRKAFAASWKITDAQVKALSSEASKRVKSWVEDPEEVRRNVGVLLDNGLRKTMANQDWNNAAKLSLVALKMTDGPTKVELTVKTKQPTPADAAQAVKDLFGVRVSNAEDLEGTVIGETEPADGDPKGSSEE